MKQLFSMRFLQTSLFIVLSVFILISCNQEGARNFNNQLLQAANEAVWYIEDYHRGFEIGVSDVEQRRLTAIHKLDSCTKVVESIPVFEEGAAYKNAVTDIMKVEKDFFNEVVPELERLRKESLTDPQKKVLMKMTMQNFLDEKYNPASERLEKERSAFLEHYYDEVN